MIPSRNASTPPSAASPNMGRRVFAAPLAWGLVGLLGISNGLTLVNDTVHSAAYNLISSVAQGAGEAVARRILSRSPTSARTKEVEIATRDLKARAIEWSATRGARSGRVAIQFVRQLAGEQGKAV